jgi:hypothetical protein
VNQAETWAVIAPMRGERLRKSDTLLHALQRCVRIRARLRAASADAQDFMPQSIRPHRANFHEDLSRCSFATSVALPLLCSGCFLGDDFRINTELAELQVNPPSVSDSTEHASLLPPASAATDVSQTAPPPSSPAASTSPLASSEPVTSTDNDSGLMEDSGAKAELDAGGAVVSPELDAASSDSVVEAGLTPSCERGWGYDPDLQLCVQDCGSAEEPGPNGRCYWFGTQGVTFNQAQSTCSTRDLGWSMISVKSSEEDAFFQEHLVAATWLGATDSAIPNTWRWVDDNTTFWQGSETGAPVNDAFTRWADGEPSASSNEACVRYHATTTGWNWSDSGCTEWYRAACAGPLPVEPTYSSGGDSSGRDGDEY